MDAFSTTITGARYNAKSKGCLHIFWGTVFTIRAFRETNGAGFFCIYDYTVFVRRNNRRIIIGDIVYGYSCHNESICPLLTVPISCV